MSAMARAGRSPGIHTGKTLRTLSWAVLAVVFALCGCRSLPEPVKPLAVVIEWPNFPDPTGKVSTVDGVTTMPAEYWLAVAQYVIDAEAGIEKLPKEYGRK
jgi:hypothetical protein